MGSINLESPWKEKSINIKDDIFRSSVEICVQHYLIRWTELMTLVFTSDLTTLNKTVGSLSLSFRFFFLLSLEKKYWDCCF